MSRRVFFSFEYGQDVFRANVVRKSWLTKGSSSGFVDAAEHEKIEKGGDAAIKKWISEQLNGTSVTVVLVGSKTCSSNWVQHEIEKSKEVGNGLLGIDISKISSVDGKTSDRCGKLPSGYPFYLWFKDEGYHNLGDWIEKAAKAAGR